MCGVNVNVFLNFYDDNKEKKREKETKKKEMVFRVVFFLFYEAAELVAVCLAANICLA
jgi:hypothetical protein